MQNMFIKVVMLKTVIGENGLAPPFGEHLPPQSEKVFNLLKSLNAPR